MARNLYDQLRHASLRTLGYDDGGEVADDGFGDNFGISVIDPRNAPRPDPNAYHVVDQTGKLIRLPKATLPPSQPQSSRPPVQQPTATPAQAPAWQDPLAGIGQKVAAAGAGWTTPQALQEPVNLQNQEFSSFNQYLGGAAAQAQQGWKNLTTPWQPGDPTPGSPEYQNRKAQAASDVIRGGATYAEFAGLPEIAADPLPLVGGWLTGYGTAYATEKAAQQAGLPSGEAALASDIAAGVGEPTWGELNLLERPSAPPAPRGIDVTTGYPDGAAPLLQPDGMAKGGRVKRYADGGAITLDPVAIERELPWQDQPGIPTKISIDPNAPRNQSFIPTRNPREWTPPPEVKPDTSVNPLLDLKLGAQSGLARAMPMIYKPAEDLYGFKLAGGQPLSQATTEAVAPDPAQLAARSGRIQRALQFAGSLPSDIARYGLATAAAGGNPILGAGAAEALGADTPEQAVVQGGLGALFGAGAEYGMPYLTKYGPKVAGKAISMLPSREELAAAGEAANARLRASGIYSGANAAMGLDPATIRDLAISTGAQLGSGAYSAAEIAAAKARQIQELIRRPSEPTPEPAAPGRDVLARSVEDLEQRIPDSQRVVSPDATRLINGQPFSSLDMDKPSEGFLPLLHLGPEEANNLNNRMWEDAIRESELPGGSAAMEAVRKTGARPPTAEFLDRAMQLPQRGRFWYELSGKAFTGDYMDIPRELQPGFIDNVAATSGGAKPYTNLKRAIGSYAENMQNLPIYTDLRDPASVRNALNPQLERLGTHKYGNFSGSMQYVSGLGDRPPLSVNDVQMADIFGIKGSDIGKNPALYEVLSRYTNKVRDAQNALLPQGAQPWETWQIQAPTWVQRRLDKDPKSTYDDYAMVFPRIIQELNDAGVPTPNGKITMQTLMDPRTPNVMSGTRQNFMRTPTGTVEFATTKTPAGAAATQMRQQLEQYDASIPWVREAKADYENIQRNAMKDFAMRHGDDPSYVSQLMSEILGKKVDVSRLEWNGYGTYEGDINPNLRIPMGGTGSKGFVSLSQPQREAFLSMLGQDLNQDGMAASHFTTMPEEQLASRPANKRTYSVWMRRFDDHVDQPAIQEFSRQVGYPVNVSRVPNGVLVDVNVADAPTGPTREAVENAANATFGGDPNVHDLVIGPRAYDGDFVHNSKYQEKIDAQSQIRQQPRRVGKAGNPPNNVSNIQRIRQTIRQIAQNQDAKFAQWTQDAQARIAKMKPPPQYASGGLAYFADGGMLDGLRRWSVHALQQRG